MFVNHAQVYVLFDEELSQIVALYCVVGKSFFKILEFSGADVAFPLIIFFGILIPIGKKIKKTTTKKPREISLYSPEYLAKKHGIQINDTQPAQNIGKKEKGKVSFGFYNSLILFIFLAIFLTRILYFAQDFVISKFPVTEFYLNYFFESIRNMFEIWKNLISNY